MARGPGGGPYHRSMGTCKFREESCGATRGICLCRSELSADDIRETFPSLEGIAALAARNVLRQATAEAAEDGEPAVS